MILRNYSGCLYPASVPLFASGVMFLSPNRMCPPWNFTRGSLLPAWWNGMNLPSFLVFVILIFQLCCGCLFTSKILVSLIQSSGTLHLDLRANLPMSGAQMQWFPQLDSLLEPLCFFPLLPYFCLVGVFLFCFPIYFYWKKVCLILSLPKPFLVLANQRINVYFIFENVFVNTLRKLKKPWKGTFLEFFSKYHGVLVLLNVK